MMDEGRKADNMKREKRHWLIMAGIRGEK